MKASHLGSWDFPYIFRTQPTSPEESCVSKTRHIHYTPYQLFSTQPVKNMVDLSSSTMSDYQELHILTNIQHMLSMSFVRLKFMVRPSLSKMQWMTTYGNVFKKVFICIFVICGIYHTKKVGNERFGWWEVSRML